MKKPVELECPICKARNDLNAKRCNQCGAWLLDQYFPPSEAESLKNKQGWPQILKSGWFFWLILLLFALLYASGALKTLNNVLIFLWLATVLALIIGLIKPSVVLKWGKKRFRGQVIKTYLSLSILLFVIIASTVNTNGTTIKAQKESENHYKASCQTMTYDNLARIPENFVGKRVTFTGKVVQINEYNNHQILRVNVLKYSYGIWKDTIWLNYVRHENEARVLDGDVIQFWGVIKGEKTYTAVLGNRIQIPEIDAQYLLLMAKSGN